MAWAVITGGGTGIGQCIAMELAKRGYDIIIASRNSQRLSEARETIIASFPGTGVATFSVDLTSDGATERLYAFAKETCDRIEILVNDAGIYAYEDFLDIPEDFAQKMIDINVSALVRMTRVFGKHFVSQGSGYIMNLSSYSVYMAYPGFSLYSATKAFVKNFTMGFADEVRSSGVSVTALAPSAVGTTLLKLPKKWHDLALKTSVMLTPEVVARKAVKAMFREKRLYTPGWYNRLFIPVLVTIGKRTRELMHKGLRNVYGKN